MTKTTTMTEEEVKQCIALVTLSIAIATSFVLDAAYDLLRPKLKQSPPSESTATARANELSLQEQQRDRKSSELAGIGALVITGSALANGHGMCVPIVNAGLQFSGMFLILIGTIVNWNKSLVLRFVVWASSLALLIYAGVRLQQSAD